MDVASLYSSVIAHGADLLPLDGGGLRVVNQSRLDAPLMAEIKAHKPELLALLAGRHNGHSTAELPARGPPQATPRPPSAESAVTAEAAVLAHGTSIPDVFTEWIVPYLPEGELRVMLYLLRRTLGFHKVADCISLGQFAEGLKTRDGRRLDPGTQMERKSVVRALDGLVRRGLILCERAPAGAAGHPVNTYRLHFEGFLTYVQEHSG